MVSSGFRRLSPPGVRGREWREDCPYCKAPYPWAPTQVKAAYHRRYLKDLEDGVALPLAYVPEAEAAFRVRETSKARSAERQRREERRARLSSWGARLDTWPKRVMAVAAAITAVLALFGLSTLTDVFDKGGHRPAAPATSVPGRSVTIPSAGASSAVTTSTP